MTGQASTECTKEAAGQQAPSSTIPVAINVFRKSMPDCDIFVRKGDDGALTLYRKKSQPLDSSDLDRLEKRGIRELYVSHADQESHRRSKAPSI